MSTFEEYRKRFRGLYDAVKQLHESSSHPHQGHGLDHDVTVAMFGVRISPDARTAEKAFCVGMMHSTDRIVEQTEIPRTLITCLDHLPAHYFTPGELDEIYNAAFEHEVPQDDDSLVKQVLMDADRLANIMLSGALRAAQWLNGKPVVEFEYLAGARNPATTWDAPCSALDGVRVVYQMLHPMRTPKGIELAKVHVAQISASSASRCSHGRRAEPLFRPAPCCLS